MSIFRRRLMMSIKKGVLPSAYQQVEYLESTGTQYIDTGFIPSKKLDFDIDFEVTASTFNFGEYGSSKNRYQLSYAVGTYKVITIHIGNGTDYTYSQLLFTSKDDTKYTNFNAKLRNSKVSLTNFNNGELISENNMNRDITNMFAYNLLLFAYRNYGQIAYNKGRIKKITLWDNDNELIRNMIACYRKSDNEIGMYDTVTKTFFTNQGTGTFLKGGNV